MSNTQSAARKYSKNFLDNEASFPHPTLGQSESTSENLEACNFNTSFTIA